MRARIVKASRSSRLPSHAQAHRSQAQVSMMKERPMGLCGAPMERRLNRVSWLSGREVVEWLEVSVVDHDQTIENIDVCLLPEQLRVGHVQSLNPSKTFQRKK